MNYRLALLCEALGDMEGAEQAINAAFKHAYFNEILLTKHRVEAELKAAVGADSRPLLASGHVTTKPTYWDSTREQVCAHKGHALSDACWMLLLRVSAARSRASLESVSRNPALVPCSSHGLR
jgi:hypothetical protein